MLKELNLAPDADWRKRYEAPIIAGAQVAQQNPSRGMVVSNRDGVIQLYAWDVDSGNLRQLTDHPTGITQGTLSEDGKWVYHFNDERGNEHGHFVRIPYEGGEAQDITPDMDDYNSFVFTQSPDGRTIGFTAAYSGKFQIYVLDAETLERKFTTEFSRAAFGPSLSHNGNIAAIASTEPTNSTNTVLELYDVLTGEHIAQLWDGEDTSMSGAIFSAVAGDERLVCNTSASGFNRPVMFDARTQERHDLPVTDLEGDIAVMDWSRDGRYLLLRQLNQAIYQLWLYDLENDELLKMNHPAGTYFFGFFAPNGNIFVTNTSSEVPARVIELDVPSGDLKRVVFEQADMPASRAWRSVTYNTSDGTPIQAWLVTPEGDGPFPTIVHTHGGPTAVTTDSFSAESQAWIDHGFAFFSLNYRGSVTFGKDFQHAIDGNLGDLEVEDIEAGVKWLIDEGIAHPNMIMKTGGSYGGYLTLQSLGKKPDLWAGGMAVVAIADWRLMYEDQAPMLQGYQRNLFGGTPDEKPEAHAKSSPITYAEQIKGDILVIQGRNDTRCPSRQMEVYEKKLNELGKSIHIHWFDAGHGSREIKQQIEQMELKLRFAYRVLG